MSIEIYIAAINAQLGLNDREWVNPCEEIEPQIYTLKRWKTHHSHQLLADDSVCVFFSHMYQLIKIVALYITHDNLIEFLTDKKYWAGAPSVQQMIPDTNIGLFQVSGTYFEPPVDVEEEES